jgi:hypothetical protein
MMSFDQHIVRAREIFFNYEPYRSMSPHEIGHRIDVPASLGKYQHWTLHGTGDDVVFTWARPGKERSILMLIDGECPDYEFWQDHDPTARLWIVDMAAKPGTSGVRVGRLLQCALAETKVAKDGELVLFRRNGGARPGRFGKAICRR